MRCKICNSTDTIDTLEEGKLEFFVELKPEDVAPYHLCNRCFVASEEIVETTKGSDIEEEEVVVWLKY